MSGILDLHLLSLITFSPIVLGLGLLLIPKDKENWARTYSVVASLVPFLLSLILWQRFNAADAGFQMAERMEWLPDWGISYYLGIDGVSLVLVMLSTFLMPIIFLASWRYIETKVRSYCFFMFFLETGMIGAFVAMDLFLFYIFWEAMLIPMFFIIGVWGGKERIYAAGKFMLYTIAGSLPMLVAIIYLLAQHKLQLGTYSAALVDLYRLNLPFAGFLSPQSLVFVAFCLAFAVKVPMFPLHTWLPDAHVQAPTGGSVILAGVLLKLGIYGFMRFAIPFAPAAAQAYAPCLMTIAAVAIVYGAFVATVQTDIKKLVAYSSVSHMGYIVLGLFAMNKVGVTGSVYQMLNHGISTGALFLLVGILYERKHTREIVAFQGLAKTIPLFGIIFIIMTMSSIALPGTNGFVGEFLILQGAFLAKPILAAIAGLGVIFGAVYMLWLCQRILFGEPNDDKDHPMKDISLREFACLAPLIVLVFAMGLYPKAFLSRSEASISYFVDTFSAVGKPYAPQVTSASGAVMPGMPSVMPEDPAATSIAPPAVPGSAPADATSEGKKE